MTAAPKLRGASRLAIDLTTGLTDLVEAMHAEIGRLPGTAPRDNTRGLTGLVYRSVRGVTRLVGGGLDASLAALAPLLGQAESARADAVVAALNGVLGDHLEASANPLALAMSLRPLAGAADAPVDPDATGHDGTRAPSGKAVSDPHDRRSIRPTPPSPAQPGCRSARRRYARP